MKMPRFKQGNKATGGQRAVTYASSPLLASKTPLWRSRLLVALVGMGFCALLGRAAYIQLISPDFFQKQGELRYAHTLELPASRGQIKDRTGHVLATSVAAPSIWAIPKDMDATAEQKRELAKLLGLSNAELDRKLSASTKFSWLRRQVDNDVAKQVKALGLKGVFQEGEYRRSYPEGEVAAHVVGFTNLEDNGQEGIELAFQRDLQGHDGTRAVLKDRLGRVIEDVGQRTAPRDGREIELSIDSQIQFFAYQRVRDAVAQHKAKAGSAVVIDAQTGEVLALANYPSFDPANRKNLTGNQLRNRAVTDTFEPGSTMKPFIAALAMDSGRVTPSTRIDTGNGTISIGGFTIRDTHAHGNMSVAEVIQKSSNVGTIKMAMQMQPREMYDMFTQIGLGQKPKINFPGAVTGRLRPYKAWRPSDQAAMSYGYAQTASLLQLAHAYTVFARDGELIPVSMQKVTDPVGGTRVFTVQTAQAVRQMLQMAAGNGGTAPKAQTQGYSVGGKTGTARKLEGKVYSTSKYRPWFVGMSPINNPRLIVAVMVDEPSAGMTYGGDVAAPVFSQIVQQSLRLMNVSPDLDVKSQIIAKTQAADAERDDL